MPQARGPGGCRAADNATSRPEANNPASARLLIRSPPRFGTVSSGLNVSGGEPVTPIDAGARLISRRHHLHVGVHDLEKGQSEMTASPLAAAPPGPAGPSESSTVRLPGPGSGGWPAGIEFRDLRYFTVLAEELHFGRAAARLFITQPGLSQAIARLERLLEVRLFTRTRSTVELAPAGAELLQCGRRLLADVDATVARVRMAGRGQAGLVPGRRRAPSRVGRRAGAGGIPG
jgi:Bacterial regulatory helix-turn-helix protein, lysR family